MSACRTVGRTWSLARGVTVAAGALVCLLLPDAGRALELTAGDGSAGYRETVALDSATLDSAAAKAVIDAGKGKNRLRFSVTPIGAIPSAGKSDVDTGFAGGIATGPGLLYFTPRVANFDIGRSSGGGTCKFISPELANASCYKYAIGELGGPVSGTTQLPGGKDAISIGVTYQRRVRDLDLGLSTTVVSSARDSSGVSPVALELQSWKLDLSAGYTGFTFSTSYFEDRAKGDGGRDAYSGLDGQEIFDLGIKYDRGPWAFGLQYRHSELGALRIGPDPNDQQVDSYEIGGSYLMGQRLSLGAAIQFWKWDEFVGTQADEDRKKDLLFLIGSHLKF